MINNQIPINKEKISLTGKQVKNTYQGLLNLNGNDQGLYTSAQSVKDGLGGTSPLSLATNKVLIYGNNYPTSVGSKGQAIIGGGPGELLWGFCITRGKDDARYTQLSVANTLSNNTTVNGLLSSQLFRTQFVVPRRRPLFK